MADPAIDFAIQVREADDCWLVLFPDGQLSVLPNRETALGAATLADAHESCAVRTPSA